MPDIRKVLVFGEPGLEFAEGQRLQHPRDGISLFGPFDSKGIEKPRHITYALFGTTKGADDFRVFSYKLSRPITTSDDLAEALWPDFPGFEEAFHAVWSSDEAWYGEISEDTLRRACAIEDSHERVYSVVNLYLQAMSVAKARDDRFDVFICVVPEIVYATCRVLSSVGRVLRGKERRLRSVMGDFFADYDSDQYQYSLDFRRQIKARAMELGVPIQIVRESTLRLNPTQSRSERQLTPLSDRAWNLSTTLYYKSGGKLMHKAASRIS